MVSSSARNRLSKAAKDLLESSYQEEKYPTPLQKSALLQQIQQIPGLEDYSKSQLTTWFNTKRAKEAKRIRELKVVEPVAEPQYTSRTHAILYPTIKVNALADLLELYDEHIQKHKQSPPLEIICLWATHLHADVAHVKNWVNEKAALEKSTTTAQPPGTPQAELSSNVPKEPSPFVTLPDQPRSLSQLPTPSQSTSPEPIAGPSCTVKPEPPLSPTIGRPSSPFHFRPDILQHGFDMDDHEERVRRLESSESSITQLPSPVSPLFPEGHLGFARRLAKTHPYSQTQTNPVPVLNAITRRPPSPKHSSAVKGKNPLFDIAPRLQNALISQGLPAVFPRNAPEFNVFFQPHEAKIRTLLQRITDGSLRHAGWDSSLASNFSVPPPPYTPKRR